MAVYIDQTLRYSLLVENPYTWIAEADIGGSVEFEHELVYHLIPYKEFVKNFWGCASIFSYNIAVSLDPEFEQHLNYSLREYDSVEKAQALYYNLLNDDGTIDDPRQLGTVGSTYQVQILLDGDDVTGYVKSCSISYSVGNFTGECTLTFADPSFYPKIDCSDLDTNYEKERIEVWTSKDGGDLVCQGKFYIEKRDTSVSAEGGVEPQCWGRTTTCRLDRPYASPFYYTNEDTVYAEDILAQIIADSELTDLVVHWNVMNYQVQAYRFAVDNVAPIEAISQLASPLGAAVSTNKAGELIVHYQWEDE